MKKLHRWNVLLALALAEGLAALVFYFRLPSETANAGWLGYSTSRWLVGGVVCLLVLVLSILLIFVLTHRAASDRLGARLNAWFESGSHVWAARVLFLVGLLACLETYLLSYLSLPLHLRPLILWLALLLLEALAWSFWFFR